MIDMRMTTRGLVTQLSSVSYLSSLGLLQSSIIMGDWRSLNRREEFSHTLMVRGWFEEALIGILWMI